MLKIGWDPVPDPNVAGYRVYERMSPDTELVLFAPWFVFVDVGNTNVYETQIEPNTFYYFVVTAYNYDGIESDFSNELVCIDVKPIEH